jgi:hypothetical protein
MTDSANLTLLFDLFANQLADLEVAVASIGIQIPSTPIARPINGSLQLVEHAANLMHERQMKWIAQLLAREEHLMPPNRERNAARELGRLSHAWYEASKALYAKLGLTRNDPVIISLFAEACLAAPTNSNARRFLDNHGVPFNLFFPPPSGFKKKRQTMRR